MKYLIDADVLIQAKNAHYRFALCPGFWDWLDQANQAGTIHSVERIYEEIRSGGDDLADWATERRDRFFLAPDDAVVAAMPSVAQWAEDQPNYRQAARRSFEESGDFYLVGHALANELTVVTQEASAPNSETSIKIPDACQGVGVACMNPFEMLVAEGAKFVL
jgi:hypothetical protein